MAIFTGKSSGRCGHEEVGGGDGGDAAADAVGLGLFGPAELVNGQHHLEPQVPDRCDDALVAAGKGIEGAGEEGDFSAGLEMEAAVGQLLLLDKAVDAAQGGGAVIEGQVAAAVLPHEEEDLLSGQGEGPALLVTAEDLGAEHAVPQHPQRLLAHAAAGGGQSLCEHAQQPLPAGAEHLVRLREALAVGLVVLIKDAHRIQHRAARRLLELASAPCRSWRLSSSCSGGR